MSKETRQRKDLPRTAVRRPVSPQTSARQRPRKQTSDDTPPTLSVIDARMEKRARLFSSSVRLMPMAALGIVVFTVLMIAMIILGKTGQLGISLSYNVGVEEYGLFSILSIGLIPILTASVMILMFRPTSAYVLGLAPVTTSCVSEIGRAHV